jgi:hypothetical protein
MGRFLDERCILAPDARIAKRALLIAYRHYCTQAKVPILDDEPMMATLARCGITATHHAATRTTTLHGVGLRAADGA